MIFSKNGLTFISFNVPGWGDFKIAKIQPKETSWGVFEGIRWRALIDQVSEESVDLALSGHPKPFLDYGIRDARATLRLLGLADTCAESALCLTYKEKSCTLRSKKSVPDCFTADGLTEKETHLLRAWIEGYTIVRIE